MRNPPRALALVALLLVATIVVVEAGPSARPAAAHSSLIDASPAPDAVVGGTIDSIELAFNEPVSEAEMGLSYNEEPVEGVTAVTDGEVIRFELAQPLETPGRYEISFQMISFDSDFTTSAFFFTYDTEAAPPPAIGEPGSAVTDFSVDDGGEGFGGTLIGISLVLLAVLFALLALFVWRLEARRQGEANVADG